MLLDKPLLQHYIAELVEVDTFYEIFSAYEKEAGLRRDTGDCRCPLGKVLGDLSQPEYL